MTPNGMSPSAKTPRHRYRGHWLTAGVLTLTLFASYQGWQIAAEDLEHSRQVYFEFRVRELVERIEKRFEAYEQVLYGARGLFAASSTVTRDDYRLYISTQGLDRRFPGIQGVGFSLLIPKAEKDHHVAEMRRQGFTDYDIRPNDERDIYTSIVYLEPFAGRNLRAFSYDMFSEATRNKAMSYARDNDSLGVSGRVTLLQETDQDVQAGFLMYLPVYKKNQPHDTLEQRRANLYGWVYAPFRTGDFMAGIGGERERDLRMAIFDGDQIDEAHRMYGAAPTQTDPDILTSRQHIILACHSWTVLIHSEPTFQTRIDRDKPLIIGSSGLSLSLLLSLLTWQLVNARTRALTLAEAMTMELRESETRFRSLANSAPVLIWLADTDKRRHWFNKVWLDFTGRTLDEEAGSGWLDGVHPHDVHFCSQYYDNHFEGHQAFNIEFRLKRHDGEYRWLLDTGIPRYDENGIFLGYIGSCIDITELRQIRTALENSNADLSRFAEIATHHLMEPTRRFTSYTQRLAGLLAGYPDLANNADIQTCLRYLEQDAHRLRALVRDIKHYITADQARDKIGVESAEQAVAAALAKLTDQLQAVGTVVCVGALPPAHLDLPRLTELFSLLLDNALLHGLPADPQVAPRIEVGGVSTTGISRYYVRDNGSGIDSEFRQRVFEIFERLGYRDGASAGTGIGLSIARRIVNSCGGRIWIENAEYGGTVVFFELPNSKN